jgi:hypothetical protein
MDARLAGSTLALALAAATAPAAVNVQKQSSGQFYARMHGEGSTKLRYDIVIVGDGFTASQQGDFNARAADVVSALEARQPYTDRMCAFNVWRVNVVTQQSGVDHPKDNVFPNTELDVRYGVPANGEAERCITSDSPAKVHEAAAWAPEADAIFVLANDTQSGGCADDLVFSSISAGFAAIVTHELGHKIGALADEYNCYICDGSDSNVTYSGPDPDEGNCDRDKVLAQIKWKDLISGATALPTTTNNSPGVVGAWESCKYSAKSIYRPQTSCHMLTTGAEFCRRDMRALLGAHCTACEKAETPIQRLLACYDIPLTRPPVVGDRAPEVADPALTLLPAGRLPRPARDRRPRARRRRRRDGPGGRRWRPRPRRDTPGGPRRPRRLHGHARRELLARARLSARDGAQERAAAGGLQQREAGGGTVTGGRDGWNPAKAASQRQDVAGAARPRRVPVEDARPGNDASSGAMTCPPGERRDSLVRVPEVLRPRSRPARRPLRSPVTRTGASSSGRFGWRGGSEPHRPAGPHR